MKGFDLTTHILGEGQRQREHELRNEMCRLVMAIRLARSALSTGDVASAGEMLAEAGEASDCCRELLFGKPGPSPGGMGFL